MECGFRALPEITTEEINIYLSEMKNNKAAGAVGTVIETIKKVDEPFQSMMNSSDNISSMEILS